jgi:GTP:adenosylcobinamide-phosphate guanylyltransferase
MYLRRLLGLNSRSVLAVLFTETGIMPLRFRRVLLAVSYLAYVLRLSQSHYARSAYEESLVLARRGLQCWVTDLRWVVSSLPGPSRVVLTELHFYDPELLQKLQKFIADACNKYICSNVLKKMLNVDCCGAVMEVRISMVIRWFALCAPT